MSRNIEERLIDETEHFRYYQRYIDGAPVPNGQFMRLKEPLWFLGRPTDVLREHCGGIEIDRQTAEQLEDVFPGVDKYYYLYALATHDYREAIKWILGPIASAMKKGDTVRSICPPWRLAKFVDALAAERFPRHFAREIFARLIAGENLDRIVADPKYAPADIGAVEAAVSAVLAAHPQKLAEAASNPKLLQWFVGQVLKANKGMPPALAKDALERQIRCYASQNSCGRSGR